MDNIDDRHKAHTDYELMLLGEEKLEPLIMKNRLRRTPNDVVRIIDIALNRKEQIEFKGENYERKTNAV